MNSEPIFSSSGEFQPPTQTRALTPEEMGALGIGKPLPLDMRMSPSPDLTVYRAKRNRKRKAEKARRGR